MCICIAAPVHMQDARCQHSSAMVLPDQKVVVFGGWDGAVYTNAMFEYEFAEPVEKEGKKGKK